MALAVTSSTLSGAVSSRNILHSAGRKVRGGQLKTKIHQQAIRLIQFSLQFYTFNTDIMIDIHIQMLREETKSENYRERYSTKQTACKSRNHPPPSRDRMVLSAPTARCLQRAHAIHTLLGADRSAQHIFVPMTLTFETRPSEGPTSSL